MVVAEDASQNCTATQDTSIPGGVTSTAYGDDTIVVDRPPAFVAVMPNVIAPSTHTAESLTCCCAYTGGSANSAEPQLLPHAALVSTTTPFTRTSATYDTMLCEREADA